MADAIGEGAVLLLDFVGAGGAVVADSDPGAEYAEMLAKLRAPLPAGWRAE